MNRISIIAIILLICSCGTSRKITQTETHSKVNIESSFLDTSKRAESWEMIVNSVVKEIDLSKIKITTYYPQKDSNGQQFIRDEIYIDNYKSFISSESKRNTKLDQIQNRILMNSKVAINKSEYIQNINKKTIRWQLYFIFFSIIVFTLFIAFKK